MMMRATVKKGRVTAPFLPEIGETIYVDNLGPARVEGLTHNDYDNFIRLKFLETDFGEFTQDQRFAVEP